MTVYKFFDTDSTGQKEYDIAGSHYRILLKTCFAYCNTFSVMINYTVRACVSVFDGIEEYRLPITKNITRAYRHYGDFSENKHKNGAYEIRHYKLCPETQKILIDITDSIFKWIYGWGYSNPEDPAFYRADGSVFFCSTIHEGECTLLVNEGENIADIVSCGPWIKIT